ncbi:MAG: PQQ-binding-like beta-propeller repeat protein [Candidatus Poseidoniia archaeon]|nr:PQQ-binding-like beta-propeller repeat protein [Candidatus Poseidoniia archaeon]
MKPLFLLVMLLLLALPVSGGMHNTSNIDLQGEPTFLVAGSGGGVVAWRDAKLHFLQDDGSKVSYTTTSNVTMLAVDYKAQRAALIEGENVVLYGAEGVLMSATVPGDEPVGVALSSAGNYIAAGFASGSVRLWKYGSGEEMELRWTFPDDELVLNDGQREQIRNDLQNDLRLVLKGDYLAVTGTDQLYIVRRNDGGLRGDLGKYTFDQPPFDLEMSADGKVIAVATAGKLHAYILESGERKWKFATPEANSSRALAVAPDGSLITLLHGIQTQIVSGFEPSSGEPAWNHEVASVAVTANPQIAATGSRVAITGLGPNADDLTLLDRSGKQVGELLTEAQSPLVGASDSTIVIATPQGIAFYATHTTEAQSADWLSVDTRTIGLATGALLLVTAIGAMWWFELLEMPFGATPPTPPATRQISESSRQPLASRFPSGQSTTTVNSAPLKVKPVVAHGTATIACPGCSAQMEVPKLGRIQKVECGECGLAGNAEI